MLRNFELRNHLKKVWCYHIMIRITIECIYVHVLDHLNY